MKLRLATILGLALALAPLAAADNPPPTPPPSQAPEVVHIVPRVTMAKQGLTARDTITIRGTLPNENKYTFDTRPQFSADTKILQITLDVTAPKNSVAKRNPQDFSVAVPVPDLKSYKGEFSIVVVAPDGKELHRFDKARM